MAQVNLTVNGRVYKMACEDGEEDHVTELGQRFDEAINELRAVLGEIGDQRLMVMAGILMTDRLGDAEKRLVRVEQDMQGIKDGRADMAMRIDGLAEEVHMLTSDRARLAEALDQMQARAGKLDTVNRDVSRRLDKAIETIREVLAADEEKR